MRTADLADVARIPFMSYAGLSLVQGRDALALVAEIERAGVRVLGIEGYFVSSEGVQPNMDAIADFSEVTSVEQSVQEAIGFLSRVDMDLQYFEFVLE